MLIVWKHTDTWDMLKRLMKNIFILFVVALCTISVAFASGVIVVTDTAMPEIQATFNESVNLINFSLIYGAGQPISLSNTTTDNKTFLFNPLSPLLNGFYSFVVDASDLIGNTKVYSKTLIMDVNETNIFFVNPVTGISRTQVFNLTVGTSRAATCKWSLTQESYDQMNSFDVTGGLLHTIHNFDATTGRDIFLHEDLNELPILYVSCVDSLGLNVSNELPFGYDDGTPSISIESVSQNPVISYPPATTIVLSSNERVVCSWNGNIFDGQSFSDASTYSYYPSQYFSYPSTIQSNGDYNYNIVCSNLAETTASLSQEITVALQPGLEIEINYPSEFIQSLSGNYQVTTNKPATCTLALDGGAPQQMTSGNLSGEIQTLPVSTSILNGTHSISVLCYTPSESQTATQTFTIDNTPPTAPMINLTSCSPDVIDMLFSSTQNISGIAGYNYTISGTNLSINWTFSSSGSFSVNDLDLLIDNDYTVQAFAISNAGVPSDQSTGDIVFNPNESAACHSRTPPVLIFVPTQTSYGTLVDILCDSQNGCDNTTIQYGLGYENCTSNTPGSEFTLTQTQYICAQAQDIYGNTGYAGQTIYVNSSSVGSIGSPCTVNSDCTSNFCINDTCQSAPAPSLAPIGAVCAVNSDCTSNFCGTNNTCEATSCTDGVKNGLETDVDCGGPSCPPCSPGKACSLDSDCSSSSCQYGFCASSTSVNVTAPVISSNAGDFFRYSLLFIGILVILTGLLLLFYFKTDKQTGTYVVILGGVALLFVIIDWFIYYLPRPILLLISLGVIGGAGYLCYGQKNILIQKMSGKPPIKGQINQLQGNIKGNYPQKQMPPMKKEDLAATKQMIEMLQKQKALREQQKEEIFSKFSRKGTTEVKKQGGGIEPIKIQQKIVKQEPIISKGAVSKALPDNRSVFDRLSSAFQKISGKSAVDDLSKLGKSGENISDLEKLTKSRDAVEKLSSLSKSKEDVFKKLPSSKKNIDELSNINKKNKKRK